jgi:ABC-type amino acid transport substrate-binding protein
LKKYIRIILTAFLVFLLLGVKSYSPDRAYQAITSRKKITVGISSHYPPLNFKGQTGLDLELASALGKFLGVRVQYKILKITEYVSAIETGKVDIVIAGMSRNMTRAQRIWFSEPYLTVTPAMVVNKRLLPQAKVGDQFETESIKTIWDLKRLNYFTIAVKKGSSYIELLKNQMPDMEQKIITTNDEGINLILKGKINGFIHDSLYLEYIYNKNTRLRSSCTLLRGGKQVEKICIGLPFGDMVLKNQVNTLITELKRTGQIDKWLSTFKQK